MFKYILIIVLLLISAEVFSQSKTDSLKKLLNQSKSDTTKLSLLIKIGIEFKKQPDSAISYFNEVINTDLKGVETYIAKARLLMGVVYFEKKNREIATKYFQQLIFDLKQLEKNNPRQKNIYQKYLGQSYHYLSRISRDLQQNIAIIDYADTSLTYFETIMDSTNIMSVNLIKATAYVNLSLYDKSINCLYIAYEIAEKLNNKDYMVRCTNNIAYVYFLIENLEMAKKYWEKSLIIAKDINAKDLIGRIELNIGNIYGKTNQHDSALFYYNRSLKYMNEINDKNSLALIYNNIGNIYMNKKEPKAALENYEKAIEISKQIPDTASLALLYNNVARLYYDTENYTLSSKYAKESLLYAERANDLLMQISSYDRLYLISKKNGDFKNALDYHEKWSKFKDSVFTKEKISAIQDLEVKYQTQKKEQENAILKIENELSDKTIHNQRIAMSLAILIVIIVIITLIFVFLTSRKLKKYNSRLLYQQDEILLQKEEITAQRDELESNNIILEQQKEEIQTQAEQLLEYSKDLEKQNKKVELQNDMIWGSIRYAQTIQNAILPSQDVINHYFENFIIYKPKDIVSGDFFWLNGIKKDNRIDSEPNLNADKFHNIKYLFFAVVDCTGHGVPGAFMSMIGSILLNEIVFDKKIYSPSDILDQLNNSIKKSLRQSETDNSDGMDIALVRLEQNNSDYILTFCGAKNSIFYFAKSQNKLHKLPADRKTIGGIKENQHIIFENQIVTLAQGDTVYLLTDGLIDQNNTVRKRFGSQKLSELIHQIIDKPMAEQGSIILNELNNWMGTEEQRDDITLVGLKI